LNLVLLPRELQPEADRFDASYRFVGQCPGDRWEPDAFPWHELSPDPLIYLAFETVLDRRPEFFRACAEAFGGLPFEVVVSVGPDARQLPGERGAPANFRLLPSVPLAKLLERTTLAISGGEAAIVEPCARNGVPQLLYAQHGEQFLLAGRVQQLGAGLRLDDGDLEGGRLRQLAGRVLAEPSYCRAAEALRQSIAQSGGASEACREILAFVSRVSRTVSS
jgi:MGT family glycosyltransferase